MVLHEKSKHERPRIRWFYLHEMSGIGNSRETENRLVAVKTIEGGRNGEWLLMDKRFLLDNKNVLKLDTGDGSTTVKIY